MLHNNSQQKTRVSTSAGPLQPIASVSIVGARGYAGLELAKLLLQHPLVQLTHCFATQAFTLTHDIFDDKAKSVLCLSQDQLESHLTDIVFLATPAEVSVQLAPEILKRGKKVIDLSGAFRLKAHSMKDWYGFTAEPKLLQQAVYGLQPFSEPFSADTALIANPGCYASAISLALIPLLKSGVIEVQGLAIDAKSGTTGAGKKPSEQQLFAEVSEDCAPYRVGRHQHLPEIQETVHNFTQVNIDPHFVTSLLPVRRGIIASVFAQTQSTDVRDIDQAYAKAYGDYPLVRFGADVTRLAKLKHVVGTPHTHLSYELVENKLYLFSALDNLLKGAASQAVENMNRLLDLPVAFSLTGRE